MVCEEDLVHCHFLKLQMKKPLGISKKADIIRKVYDLVISKTLKSRKTKGTLAPWLITAST